MPWYRLSKMRASAAAHNNYMIPIGLLYIYRKKRCGRLHRNYADGPRAGAFLYNANNLPGLAQSAGRWLIARPVAGRR